MVLRFNLICRTVCQKIAVSRKCPTKNKMSKFGYSYAQFCLIMKEPANL